MNKKSFFLIALIFLVPPAFCKDLPDPLVLVPSGKAPVFKDDSDLECLKKAVEQSLLYYSGLPENTFLSFGKQKVKAEKMAQTLKDFSLFLSKSSGTAEFNDYITSKFNIYRRNAKVTFSAYNEHSFTASLTKTEDYRYPIYGRPPDLVDVHMNDFYTGKRGERIVGRVDGKNLVPYYTREDIDSGRVLQGKGLEIAWAKNPLDILYLQTEGSGWIRLYNSTEMFHIRYAGDNGRPFRSVGATLIDSGKIKKEEFSRNKMADYFSGLNDNDKQALLNINPRYVFFELVSSTNLTRGSLLVSLTAGRSIAVDPKIYPPGALAWISTERPSLDANGNVAGKTSLARFVLSQDEGGAIQGPDRIDFFLGGGAEAEQSAQHFWNAGDLYFFVRKK